MIWINSLRSFLFGKSKVPNPCSHPEAVFLPATAVSTPQKKNLGETTQKKLTKFVQLTVVQPRNPETEPPTTWMETNRLAFLRLAGTVGTAGTKPQVDQLGPKPCRHRARFTKTFWSPKVPAEPSRESAPAYGWVGVEDFLWGDCFGIKTTLGFWGFWVAYIIPGLAPPISQCS